MGRYVPPDAEGVLTANQASGKGHALGRRAAKLKTEGALVVRFEMPFAVWCDGCEAASASKSGGPRPQIIGQGVRFNAEKRRAGSYHSTPIWSFRMRHAACGGWLEIRTDPQHTAYVVVSGGRRRDTEAGDERAAAESLVGGGDAALLRGLGTTPAEREEQRASAFSSLERTIEDRAALAAAGARIDAIGEVSARQWDDPYARNQALRKAFRVGRHQREREGAADDALRDRMSLGIDLLPETEEDVRRAQLIDFGTRPASEDESKDAVLARPLFGDGKSKMDDADAGEKNKKTSDGRKSGRVGKRLKSEIATTKVKKLLVSEIVGNTRLANDPFLEPRSREFKIAPLIPGLKRKRDAGEEEPISRPEERPAEKATIVSSGLVDYDSD